MLTPPISSVQTSLKVNLHTSQYARITVWHLTRTALTGLWSMVFLDTLGPRQAATAATRVGSTLERVFAPAISIYSNAGAMQVG
jgi:hypothetical protein